MTEVSCEIPATLAASVSVSESTAGGKPVLRVECSSDGDAARSVPELRLRVMKGQSDRTDYTFSGGVISIGSLVGFFTVLGIVARNGIMMVSHYRHLEEHEGMPFGPELVARGSGERLAPILMTALTTGLALIPLVLSGHVQGQEIEYPMGIVILGGLVTTTCLNLFVLPSLYLRYGKGPLFVRRRAVETPPRPEGSAG